MDFRLGTTAVDWSLIEIWCCGKFHSNADISDHAELCHAKNKTSSHQIKYTTRRSSLFGRSFLHDETEFTKSPEESAEIGQIESGGFKRKEKESEGDIEIKIQSPKRRHLSERKSKSNAEVGLASTSRVDSITLSPNISDLKNLYDDTNDVEGDMDTSSDVNVLKKQKDEVEQNIGISIFEETIISTISEEMIEQSSNKANENGEREHITKAGGRKVCMETVDNSKKGITEDTIVGVRKTRTVKNKDTARQKKKHEL